MKFPRFFVDRPIFAVVLSVLMLIAGGLALLKLCYEVWVFGDPSPGMMQEIEEAKRLHKPVKYKEA